MAHYEQYILRVTAGPTYDASSQQPVHVNAEKPLTISSEHVDANITVRIKDYRGIHLSSHTLQPLSH